MFQIFFKTELGHEIESEVGLRREKRKKKEERETEKRKEKKKGSNLVFNLVTGRDLVH